MGPADPDPLDVGLTRFRSVVRAICEYQGRVWIGTYGSGLFAVGPSDVRHFTHESSPLLENRVNVLTVRGPELWIGTCAGFSIHDGSRWRSQTRADGIAGDIYHSALVDPKDRLWIGTAGKGLSVSDGSRWRTFRVEDGLTDDWINALAQDRSGQLWIAGGSRVLRQQAGRFVEERPVWSRSPACPTSLACRAGEVWVGSAFAGLAMFQGGQWYQPPAAGALPSQQVNALAADAADRLWIATSRGIARYDPFGGWKVYGRARGLSDDNIRTLHYAPATRRLWAGSFLEGHVYLFDPAADRFLQIARAGSPGNDWARLREERRE